jgi:dihydroorotate dehydrogenase electron transfer subunit
MAVILANEPLAPGVFRLDVTGAPPGRAGQFYMLRLPGVQDPFLSRPISIFEVNPASETLSFVVQAAGRGTAMLTALLPGQPLEVQGPYGNGFPLENGRAVLVGGGVGAAPLFQLAKELRAANPNRRIDAFLGFRETAYLADAFERVADRVQVNVGGIVTEAVDFSLDTAYYACGPLPMLRAACAAAKAADAKLYVSLEKRMACGVGACLGCTCKTTHGNKRICKDGPVFAYQEVADAI